MKPRKWIAISLAAAAAAAVTASATTTTASAATTTAATASAATAVTTSARPAYTQQDLQRDLDAITATGVPGVLAEVRTGSHVLRGTSGVANLDTRAPVNASGYFRIGSNTKTFVSVVLLQLVAEHRLSLDDTVSRWLPGVVHAFWRDES